MMRVGSVGAGQVDDLPLGSTAATLANTRILPGGDHSPAQANPAGESRLPTQTILARSLASLPDPSLLATAI
jgi:hypothetical protein